MYIMRRQQKHIHFLSHSYPATHRAMQGHESGVGLIEILVAIVILAIGFLAAARMQVTSMRYSQGAYFDSQAYFMAGDMIARMRGNVEGVKSGAYDSLSTGTSLQNPGCSAKMCTPDEIAAQDIYDWSQHLHSATGDPTFVPVLPSSSTVTATGSVTRLASGAFSVSLVWADDPEKTNGSGNLRVDLFAEN